MNRSAVTTLRLRGLSRPERGPSAGRWLKFGALGLSPKDGLNEEAFVRRRGVSMLPASPTRLQVVQGWALRISTVNLVYPFPDWEKFRVLGTTKGC